MKKDIHPQYHKGAKITCACGNDFPVGSTVKEINVEICHMCHPFYTGKQKLLDTAGRVDRFKAKVAKKEGAAKNRVGKTAKRAAKAAKKNAKKEQ